jgi:hypothetical protein
VRTPAFHTIVGLALLAPHFPGCAGEQRASDVRASASTYAQASAPDAVTAGRLAHLPAPYYGRRVRVRAEVERIFSPRVFTLDRDKAFSGPDALVLIPATKTGTVTDNTLVTVTGTVRPFRWAELSRDHHWFEFEPRLRRSFEMRPVIVADSVVTATGAELLAEQEARSGRSGPVSAAR